MSICAFCIPTRPVAADTSAKQAAQYRTLSGQLKADGLKQNLHYSLRSNVWTKGKQNFVYNQAYFGKHDVTVSIMKYPSSGTSKTRTVSLYKDLTAAIKQVNRSGANIHLRYVGDVVKNADVKIDYVNAKHPENLSSKELAVSRNWVWSNKIIANAKIEFRYDHKQTTEMTMLHELGHVMGLEHTDVIGKKTVMSAYGTKTTPDYAYYDQALINLYGRK